MAIDEDDEFIGMPCLESDDEDEKSVYIIPRFEVQDGGIVEYLHNIKIMAFPDEVIRINNQT
jgi:hypothetical protein